MSFQENLNRICRERGTTLTALCRDCGYSTSKTTAINHHKQIPSEEQLINFALHLKCNVTDFFVNDETADASGKLTPEEQELLDGFRSMPRSLQYRLLGYCYELKEASKKN